MNSKYKVTFGNNCIDRRGMLNNKGVQYLLNKYRDTMMNRENEYRRALKAIAGN